MIYVYGQLTLHANTENHCFFEKIVGRLTISNPLINEIDGCKSNKIAKNNKCFTGGTRKHVHFRRRHGKCLKKVGTKAF